jgi:hypothetical protein
LQSEGIEAYEEIPFLTAYMDFKIKHGIPDEVIEVIKLLKIFVGQKLNIIL